MPEWTRVCATGRPQGTAGGEKESLAGQRHTVTFYAISTSTWGMNGVECRNQWCPNCRCYYGHIAKNRSYPLGLVLCSGVPKPVCATVYDYSVLGGVAHLPKPMPVPEQPSAGSSWQNRFGTVQPSNGSRSLLALAGGKGGAGNSGGKAHPHNRKKPGGFG